MESLGDILRRAPLTRPAHLLPDQPVEVCPICRGAGYLRIDAPVDDPRFGEIEPCECTRKKLEAKRLEILVERSKLGDLRRLTFENFILRYRDSQPPARTPDRAWKVARDYAENPTGWLLIHGAFGTGKTHLAAAIANHRLSAGEPAVFIVAPDLLDHLRSTFSPSSDVSYDELFETVRNTPLLIMDDLGTQTSTPWAQEKLYQIFNHRYNRRLPTVITTNLTLDEIEPRLRSRLGDSQLSKLCEIRDRDVRLGVEHQPQPARQPGRKMREQRP
ncbi:MAG TPA: ATP-binding protein [Chloroflexota bacterium]|nr:ATP-binding protein [Chloroflexota bacterium]